MEQIELTLGDGSSVWLDRAAIISFSPLESGTRVVFMDKDDFEQQVDVRDGFATVSDLMDPMEAAKAPGDFME